MQVEVNTGAEQGFYPGTGTNANVTESSAFCADDDGFLGVTFDVNVSPDQGWRVFPWHDFLDKNGQ